MDDVLQQVGRTKMMIHSPSGFMSKSVEEKCAWFQRECESSNLVVRRIAEMITKIEMESTKSEGPR